MSDTARTLASTVRRLNLPGTGHGLPPLLYMTDPAQGDVLQRVAALPPGTGVIFRHYDVPARARLARQVMTLCRAQGRCVLIAGDADLARQADGLHLPRRLLGRPPRLWGQGIVSAATHDLAELKRAHDLAVDAVLLSPAFATNSHPSTRPLGPVRFAALVRRSSLPVYGLGGITAPTVARLAAAGIAGVAAITGLRNS